MASKLPLVGLRSGIHLLLCTILIAHCHGSKAGQTKYGCEGEILDISCERDTVIELVRANFGRFSISICNEEGHVNWSVNCMQPKTLRIIKSICDNKRECSFPVNSTQFEDPCPGTSKYVEVHYSCRPLVSLETVKSTTNSIPPWLLALTATSAQTTTTTTSSVTSPPSTSTTSTTTASTSMSTTSAFSSSSSSPSITSDGYFDVEEPDEEVDVGLFHYFEEEMEFLPPGEFSQFCAPLTSRNLFWNWTTAGSEAVQMCPMSTRGFARWKCLENGQWSSESPDLGECQSLRISRMEDRLKEEGRVIDISSELAATTETKSLYGGDVFVISKMIRSLSHKLRQDLYALNNQLERENLVAQLLQNVLKTASNLLLDFQDLAWKDLTEPEKRISVATSLILGVEDTSLLLAETLDTEKNLVEATNHILSSVRIMKSRYVTNQEFPGPINTLHFPSEEVRILVPASVLFDNAINGAVRVSFFLYDKMDEILSPPRTDSRFINSKVAGAVAISEGGRNSDATLRDPVEVTLRHLQSEGVHHITCMSWDYVSKAWTPQHCYAKESNLTYTTCHCSKMSLYALLAEDLPHSLLDETPTDMERVHGDKEEEDPSESEGGKEYLAALISSLVGLIILIVAVILLLVFFRKRLDKAEMFHSCFHCKKRSKQGGGSSGSGGFYPTSAMLSSSSPTSSTTVSGGTPSYHPNSYLEQILNNESKRSTHGPQYKSSLLLKTNNLSQTLPHHHHQQLHGFRPVSPYGHIYMEIDPVYLQDSSGRASEISSDMLQLSDLSDDDIMKKCYASNTSGSSGISSVTLPFAEERPLISSGFGRQCTPGQQPPAGSNSISKKNFFTPQRSGGPPPARGSAMWQPQVYPAPLSIALQGGDTFVSLQIDKNPTQQGGLVFSDI